MLAPAQNGSQGPNPIPCHVKRSGEFNEEAFRALDKVLEVANKLGVRVIIQLVDNWKGAAELSSMPNTMARRQPTSGRIRGSLETSKRPLTTPSIAVGLVRVFREVRGSLTRRA
jgi:hypothetical protein